MIMQEGRPVAYYSKKLTSAQKNYSTIEQELLSIVMTLKEFKSMLLGADIHIYMDHRNLTFKNLRTQRVLRWRCFVEEFGPTLHYIKGPLNVVADTFSCLERKDEDGVSLCMKRKSICDISGSPIRSEKISNTGTEDTDESEDSYFSLLDEPELAKCLNHLPRDFEYCYLNLPEVEREKNPLNIEMIQIEQEKDKQLKKMERKISRAISYQTNR